MNVIIPLLVLNKVMNAISDVLVDKTCNQELLKEINTFYDRKKRECDTSHSVSTI